VKRAVSVVLAAALVGACGSDSDDGERGETAAETTAETPTRAPDGELFESRAIGFTFVYPEGFVAETSQRDGVLGQVAIERGDRLNAIKVRRTADRPLGPERYLDEFRRDFARTVGEVEQRRETIGGVEMGVLEFEDTVSDGDETVAFTSWSYFFAGAGRTWQVECIADDERRDEIEAACRAALESIRFRRS
jgi:hypothetical protein